MTPALSSQAAFCSERAHRRRGRGWKQSGRLPHCRAQGRSLWPPLATSPGKEGPVSIHAVQFDQRGEIPAFGPSQ